MGIERFTFRVQFARDDTWSWGVFLNGTTHRFGSGCSTKLEAIDDIKEWFVEAHGYRPELECLCGARTIYKAFAPGHGHWCPVSEYAIVEVKR